MLTIKARSIAKFWGPCRMVMRVVQCTDLEESLQVSSLWLAPLLITMFLVRVFLMQHIGFTVVE